MTTHISEELAADTKATRTPSQGSVPAPHPAQVVRKLAAVPLSLYYWISGPPATDQERLRAFIAEGTNSQAHRRIFL